MLGFWSLVILLSSFATFMEAIYHEYLPSEAASKHVNQELEFKILAVHCRRREKESEFEPNFEDRVTLT